MMTMTRKHKMKQMSIWERFETALVVLVVLQMAGCGLALGIEEAVTKADRVGEELTAKKERIRLNLLSMSDSLRGFLLDPKGETHRPEVEKDLTANFDSIKEKFSDEKDLVRSVENLRVFTKGSLLPHHKRIMELAGTDPLAALSEYNRTSPDVRK